MTSAFRHCRRAACRSDLCIHQTSGLSLLQGKWYLPVFQIAIRAVSRRYTIRRPACSTAVTSAVLSNEVEEHPAACRWAPLSPSGVPRCPKPLVRILPQLKCTSDFRHCRRATCLSALPAEVICAFSNSVSPAPAHPECQPSTTRSQ